MPTVSRYRRNTPEESERGDKTRLDGTDFFASALETARNLMPALPMSLTVNRLCRECVSGDHHGVRETGSNLAIELVDGIGDLVESLVWKRRRNVRLGDQLWKAECASETSGETVPRKRRPLEHGAYAVGHAHGMLVEASLEGCDA